VEEPPHSREDIRRGRKNDRRGIGRRAVEESPHSREDPSARQGQGRNKRKKARGGTTVLQGRHPKRKGKMMAEEEEEEGRWRNHRTPGQTPAQDKDKEEEEEEGRWRNHRTPGKTPAQDKDKEEEEEEEGPWREDIAIPSRARRISNNQWSNFSREPRSSIVCGNRRPRL
jgi:hypothetical protein